jgi:hypothetical protein
MSTAEPSLAAENSLDSFVLRFVRPSDAALSNAHPWHGVIRHIQTNRERSFKHWDEAVAFINEFVSIAADA